MYLFERAYVDYVGYLRAFLAYVKRVSRAIWQWFWNGLGSIIKDIMLKVAVVASGVTFGVMYVSYERSHGRSFGVETLLAFLLIAAYVSLLMWGWKAPVHIMARAASGSCASGTVSVLGSVSFAAAIVIFMVYLAVLVFLTALSFLVFLPMRLGQEVYLLYRQIAYECPHDCPTKGKKLPIHICECGQEYRDLKPSFYGIFHHKCRHADGKYVKLPTMDMLGRYKLQRKCADCGGYLIRSPYGPSRPFSVAAIGPVNVGKTMFLRQAMRPLCTRINSADGYKAQIIDEEKLKPDFEALDRGITLPKTVRAGDATAMAIKAPKRRGQKIVLQLYDFPGEDFQTMERFARKQALQRVEGIVLLVDPFSFPSLSGHAKRLSETLKPVETALTTIVGNMVRLLMLKGVPSRAGKFAIPLAVVLSKADALPTGDFPYLGNLYSSNGKHAQADALSARCQEALDKLGGGNAIRALQQNFSTVRYFACTAQGRMYDLKDPRPFVPAGVVEPFTWMLRVGGVEPAAASAK